VKCERRSLYFKIICYPRFALRAFSAERVNKAGNQYMHLTSQYALVVSILGLLGVPRYCGAALHPSRALAPVGLGPPSHTGDR